ncbi:hypothetical protein BC834DRAFT_971059 [Gloeopeniophorella convolvens]|nr:hypothetical protein BC834DRAFT_971059 [Gloeopeniophorella convolvens]
MVSISEASKVQFQSTREDGVSVYRAEAHPVWTFGAVPHGGYIAGLLIEACVQYQSSSAHRDPLHATVQFLRATSVGSLELQVKGVRFGKGLSNLTAELIQKAPSHMNFAPQLRNATDPAVASRFAQLTRAGDGPGGADSGCWFTFVDPAERLTHVALAFCGDAAPGVLHRAIEGSTHAPARYWLATIVLTLEFKARLPEGAAQRTVGVFSSGRFLDEPSGRHNCDIEVWSAPAELEEDPASGADAPEDWREKSRCLLVAHQMALTVQMEVNQRKRTQETVREVQV